MLTPEPLADTHGLTLSSEMVDFWEQFPDGVKGGKIPAWTFGKAKVKPKKSDVYDDVAEVYGLAAFDTMYGKADTRGELHFWNKRYTSRTPCRSATSCSRAASTGSCCACNEAREHRLLMRAPRGLRRVDVEVRGR